MRHLLVIIETYVRIENCFQLSNGHLHILAVKNAEHIYKFDKKKAHIALPPVDCIRLPEEESSPLCCYILLKSDEETRNKIDNLIKKGTVPLDRFEVGVACLSIYDGLWYRAEIVTVSWSVILSSSN